jgi:hypothetical protein
LADEVRRCSRGHEWQPEWRAYRTVAPCCPECNDGTTGKVVSASRTKSETFSLLAAWVPRRAYVGWYDIHDKSPRELAKDPKVERYNPSQVRTGKTNQGGATLF